MNKISTRFNTIYSNKFQEETSPFTRYVGLDIVQGYMVSEYQIRSKAHLTIMNIEDTNGIILPLYEKVTLFYGTL